MDFLKYVLNNKELILEKTKELLRIPSVLDKYEPNSETPFGVAINDALHYMIDLAKEDGFITKNINAPLAVARQQTDTVKRTCDGRTCWGQMETHAGAMEYLSHSLGRPKHVIVGPSPNKYICTYTYIYVCRY